MTLLRPNLNIWEHLMVLYFFLMVMDNSRPEDHLVNGLLVFMATGATVGSLLGRGAAKIANKTWP